MPDISLTSYGSQEAEIQRRQRMAEMLQQQGQQDIPIQSYGGIQAAIPWTAVLAKSLQTALGAYEARHAAQAQDAADSASHSRLLALLNGNGAAQPTQVQPPAQFRNDDYGAMAAAGPPTLSMPPPQVMPPQGPSPVGPSQVAPPLNAGPQGPAPAPVVASPVAQPPPVAPPINPLEAEMANARQEQQRWTLAMTDRSLAPSDRALVAQQAKAAGDKVVELQKLQFQNAAKEAERVAQVARTEDFIRNSPAIPEASKQAFLVGAKVNPDLAKEVMQAQIKDAFTHQLVPATPQDLAGYPEGTIAQKDPVSHELKNVYNPIPDRMNQVRAKLEAQSVAIAGGNLALRRAEFNRDNLMPPTTIEHVVNGEPVQTTAMFDKKHGRFIDMQGKPVDPTGLRIMPAGSSRATVGLLRVATAAADAATGIDNLSKLPANSNMGWFSQAANTPLGALKRTLTPQEAQDMRTTAAGLSRAMGGLATGGLAVDIPVQQSYDALIPQAGQTRLTALRQMGEMRQQAENGIDSALANPYITPQQKANLEAAKAKIASAVPWSPNDVSALETSKNPNATMRGMGVKTIKTAPAHAPYADPAKEARYQEWLKAHPGGS